MKDYTFAEMLLSALSYLGLLAAIAAFLRACYALGHDGFTVEAAFDTGWQFLSAILAMALAETGKAVLDIARSVANPMPTEDEHRLQQQAQRRWS